ncbi:MAG: hypothetical protein HYT87_19695 [Nitrospirae bacterium]|nr:hypothetical protein [Nitrospirota bacterium]
MTKARNEKQSAIGAQLGANRVVSLGRSQSQGPLDWVLLGQELAGRLIPVGGRPSDPAWDIQRLVPFNSKTWTRLKKLATRLSRSGRKVSPAQLASSLIERELGRLRT